MRLRLALMALLSLAASTAASGQGGETFTPTETVAPDIPGVVAGGTRVQVVAQGLRGTEGPIAAPDGTLLLTEQAANVITRIDAQGNRSTFLENTNGCQGLTFDQKGRLIGVLPATKQIATLTPTRTVLAAAFQGRPFAGPNDLVADRKGGVYFTDPGAYPPPGQFLTAIPAVYYVRPDGSVVRIADDIARPNGVILSPEGRHLGTIPIGNPDGPQNLAFAGPDKRTLYVVGDGAVWKAAMIAQGPRGRAK